MSRRRRCASSRSGTHSCTDPRDSEEVSSVGLGESTIAFSDVCRYREGGSIELKGEKPVSASEFLGVFADRIGEIDGLLIDQQFLEAEGHERRCSADVRER